MSPLQSSIPFTSSFSLKCPSCGEGIDVDEVLSSQATEKLSQAYQHKLQVLQKEFDAKTLELERERMEVKKLSNQTWEIIQAKLKEEKIRMSEHLRTEIQAKSALEVNHLQKQLTVQRQENTQLRQKELDLLAREEKLRHQAMQQRMEVEREVLRRTKISEDTLQQQFKTQQELVQVEYDKRLADQKKLLDEMHRKMNQGSMQLQGEVQEIVIEKYLKHAFPSDRIAPVQTGQRGGDCIQYIYNQRRQSCGSIFFESKRTKSFQPQWIDKLKDDMRRAKSDVGILVTQVMPKNFDLIGQLHGVWVCSFQSFKGLVPVLRHHLLKMQEVKNYQQQSGDKMQVLYDYLTSLEFQKQVEGIVEGFTALQEELLRERRAMERIWKRREKQIEKVLLNTTQMYGAVRGIAGDATPAISLLMLEEE